MKPTFSFFKEKIIFNVKTRGPYRLFPLANMDPTPDQLQSIVEACSSEEIYKWLFKEIFPQGYTLQNASDFIDWAREGWQRGNFFVFAIQSSNGEIAGAIDIKNEDLDGGEIGYWIHKDHSGLASNAVAAIKNIAKQAGYKRLFAQTKANNTRSENVLIKNSFIEDDSFRKNPSCQKRFFTIL